MQINNLTFERKQISPNIKSWPCINQVQGFKNDKQIKEFIKIPSQIIESNMQGDTINFESDLSESPFYDYYGEKEKNDCESFFDDDFSPSQTTIQGPIFFDIDKLFEVDEIIDKEFQPEFTNELIKEITCKNQPPTEPNIKKSQPARKNKRKDTSSKDIYLDSKKNKKKCFTDEVTYHIVVIDSQHTEKDKKFPFDKQILNNYSRNQMFLLIEEIKKNYKGDKKIDNLIETIKRHSIPYIDMDQEKFKQDFSCINDRIITKNQHHSLLSLLFLNERKLAERIVLERDESLDSFYRKISTMSFHSFDLKKCIIKTQRIRN